MYSLSTSWNSVLHSSGLKMVDEIKTLGFESIELGFALTRGMVDEILELKRKGLIKVSSVHNVCPMPDGLRISDAYPDYHNLASCDEKDRALAVDAAKKTISYAEWFGARAVILHTGKIPIKDRMPELARAL